MIDPALPLQASIKAALNASAALDDSVVGGVQVYDRVPAGTVPPYVHIRAMQVIDDGNSCSDGAEVIVDIDVWSEAVGQVEAKKIGKAVVDALDTELQVNGYRTVVGLAQSANYTTESDGLTTRGALQFRYLIDAQE